MSSLCSSSERSRQEPSSAVSLERAPSADFPPESPVLPVTIGKLPFSYAVFLETLTITSCTSFVVEDRVEDVWLLRGLRELA